MLTRNKKKLSNQIYKNLLKILFKFLIFLFKILWNLLKWASEAFHIISIIFKNYNSALRCTVHYIYIFILNLKLNTKNVVLGNFGENKLLRRWEDKDFWEREALLGVGDKS